MRTYVCICGCLCEHYTNTKTKSSGRENFDHSAEATIADDFSVSFSLLRTVVLNSNRFRIAFRGYNHAECI